MDSLRLRCPCRFSVSCKPPWSKSSSLLATILGQQLLTVPYFETAVDVESRYCGRIIHESFQRLWKWYIKPRRSLDKVRIAAHTTLAHQSSTRPCLRPFAHYAVLCCWFRRLCEPCPRWSSSIASADARRRQRRSIRTHSSRTCTPKEGYFFSYGNNERDSETSIHIAESHSDCIRLLSCDGRTDFVDNNATWDGGRGVDNHYSLSRWRTRMRVRQWCYSWVGFDCLVFAESR